MHFKITLAALAVASVFPFAVSAQEQYTKLDPVLVTATGVEMEDVDAPYASEVHTRRDIERSGAVTLVEYLSRYSSVNVLPNFGNRFTPALDMRGYGIGDGYQNVVVSVNGRRLNNIDMQPQLLGAVSLGDIERIEITKGSGSVMYGDGAMAGTIQIYTRPRTGVTLEGYVGSHGASGLSASAGVDLGRFAISASTDKTSHDGFSKKDSTGYRDESDSESWQVSLSGKPIDRLRLSLDAGKTRIDTRYPGPLTLAQFRDDPTQNNVGNDAVGVYSRLDAKSDYWQAGAELDLGSKITLSLTHSSENKDSKSFGNSVWGAYVSEAKYKYEATSATLQYRVDALTLLGGYQSRDGVREGYGSRTSKDSDALFVQAQYEFDRLAVSAGARSERVEYAYRPDGGGSNLKGREWLSAWDLGLNYRVGEEWSVFTNYNAGFQAPDIDRFFDGSGGFNGFIEPAKARTINFGVSRATEAHRFKATVFHSRLRDEIYYFDSGDYATSFNTNIDRSYKYGLELQNAWIINDHLTSGLKYAWTRAVIDREDEGGGAFNGKNLPGVSRHSMIASISAKVGDNGNFNLSHTWRSKAYAATDFANSFAQKQRAYHSTDVSYRHRVARDVELFAAVANIFERKNGVWVSDDAIYPVDFTRTWRIGARVSF